MGMREPSSGRILLGDVDISDWQVREIREAGIGYIPEDRHRHGLLLEAPLWENVVLGHQTEAVNVAGPGGILVNAAGRVVTSSDPTWVTGDLLRGLPVDAWLRGDVVDHPEWTATRCDGLPFVVLTPC